MTESVDHPLRSWRLGNFKAVEEAGVELAALTVLVGANSTGKSSLIQSMLVVAQAAGGGPGDPDLPLNGPLVDLGEFGDLRRQGTRPSAGVCLGCELRVTDRLGFAGGGPSSGCVRWGVELAGAGRGGDPGRAVVRGVELEVPGPGESLITFRARRRGVATEPPRVDSSGVQPAVALPGRIKLSRRLRGRSVFRTTAVVHRGGVPVSILATVGRPTDAASDPDPDAEVQEMGAVLPDSPRRRLEAGGRALADFLATRILHLGPLRQDPQLLYLSTPSAVPGVVGAKGEWTYAVLHRYGDRRVLCPMRGGGERELTLRDAVNHWLAELGVGSAVTTVHRPRLGLEPEVRMEGLSRGLSVAAVGVGVSQVLPVLVMGLAAQPGSVLLLEQPELHLHPAVQQRLGDFLLACVDGGRQVIVETHSDHLLTRIRRRVAEDTDDRLVASVGIVFTERTDGTTRFRQLAANRYGGLDEWPPGFFDEAARDAQDLVLAGLRKKEADDATG